MRSKTSIQKVRTISELDPFADMQVSRSVDSDQTDGGGLGDDAQLDKEHMQYDSDADSIMTADSEYTLYSEESQSDDVVGDVQVQKKGDVDIAVSGGGRPASFLRRSSYVRKHTFAA